MNPDTITLTDTDIERCRTARGGFLKTSAVLLGVPETPWPPPKGWIRKLRGKVVDRTAYDAARRVAECGDRTLAQQLALPGEKIPAVAYLMSEAPIRQSDVDWAEEQVRTRGHSDKKP